MSINRSHRVADAFEESLDFLVGEGSNASFYKKAMQRKEDIQKFGRTAQEMLFNLIDTVIRYQKAKKAYS